MSAYILLDDIPESCESCKFKDRYGNCILNEDAEELTYEEQKAQCQIKPLPTEKKRSYKKGYKSGYADGWDDCLETLEEDFKESSYLMD